MEQRKEEINNSCYINKKKQIEIKMIETDIRKIEKKSLKNI